MIKKLILFLLPVLLLSNCKKEESFLFEIPYQVEFTIPAGLNSFETHIAEITLIPARLDSLLAFNGIDPASIQSVKPRAARMSSVFANASYDFIQEVYVEVFDINDPIRVWKEVYYRQEVPFNTGNDLDLIASLEDVQEFLDPGFLNIRVRMRLRSISPEFIETRLNFSFAVR